MDIVRFALRVPHTFYILAAPIALLGGIAIKTMPADIFPEINIPVVKAIWRSPVLSTPEMEQRVSAYSQFSISSAVNGIKTIGSTASSPVAMSMSARCGPAAAAHDVASCGSASGAGS